MASMQFDARLELVDRAAAVAVLERHCPEMIGACEICDDRLPDGPLLPAILKSYTLRVNKNLVSCGHAFCSTCWMQWIACAANERRTSVGCMADGCEARLYPDDIERLGAHKDYTLIMELRSTDYRQHLLDVLKSGAGLEHDPRTRPCPSCRVLLHRKSGCDHFLCNCGTRFHFTRAAWPTIAELEDEITIPVADKGPVPSVPTARPATAEGTAVPPLPWVVGVGVGLLACAVYSWQGWQPLHVEADARRCD